MARTDRLNVTALANKIQSESDAYLFMESLRWGSENENLTCPHCGNDKAYYLAPKDGTEARKTRTGSASQRRVWKCAACRKQFSVTTGTIFHGSKIALRTWLFVVFEMCAAKNGVAAREIERRYGVTNKTAWFMLHRIREAMKREPLAGMLTGTIVADESWIGGSPKNRHRNGAVGVSGKTDKQPILSLIDTTTGEVRSTVVPDVTGATLRKVIAEQVNMAGSTLHTDAGRQYTPIGQEFADHQTVDHSIAEYVRYTANGVITSNHAEGYFSQLKRSIDGTHHHVSTEHLPRYLAEFDFRYSTRKISDAERVQRMVDRMAGRRLTYRPLTGR